MFVSNGQSQEQEAEPCFSALLSPNQDRRHESCCPAQSSAFSPVFSFCLLLSYATPHRVGVGALSCLEGTLMANLPLSCSAVKGGVGAVKPDLGPAGNGRG